MLKYIVSGQKPATVNKVIEDIDLIVNEVKERPEVTTAYMKEWERELAIKEDARAEERTKVNEDNAINLILFGTDNNISTDKIKTNLREKYGYDDNKIIDLFKKAKITIE